MLTEKEAREKWCPFSRPVFPRVEDCGYVPGNRNSVEPGGDQKTAQTLCIASECMAWRWVLTEKPGRDVPMGVKERVQGYCGLAGSPVEIRT